jgi:D-alanine--poly(phosphoribitol) ligase subunit 1
MTLDYASRADPGYELPAPWDLGLIHEAVSARATVAGQSTAIAFRGEPISYATLDQAATNYAEVLRAFGVARGTVVPVCLPRSPELVAVLLAILQCGAAYAAFDPRWPAERRAALVERLDSPVYVSRSSDGVQSPVWTVPSTPITELASDFQADRVRVPVSPADPACVFFTSGTTGAPKGVISPHRATTRLFGIEPGTSGLPGLVAGAVMPQAAPAPWDAFNLELWGMLTTGGTVVLVEDDYLLPGMVRELVRDWAVDCMWLTASLFNAFVDLDLDCFDGVRYIYSGGERLSSSHVRRFLQRYPEIELRNGYGPVESCVFATVHPISLADCELESGIPIGWAAPDTSIHILDGDLPAAVGTPGEICVGGNGLATEYFADPAQTALKFVELELGGTPTRLYRTGDLGVTDPSGVVHFRGRMDRQVKVRGYRIEPGEIEVVADSLEVVRACAVVPVPGRAQLYDRLALFYVRTAGVPDVAGALAEDPLEVAEQLEDRLPEYLVPDVIREVAQLPLTINGKLDSAALLTLLED